MIADRSRIHARSTLEPAAFPLFLSSSADVPRLGVFLAPAGSSGRNSWPHRVFASRAQRASLSLPRR